MRVFWIVFATVYILGWVWLCYSAMHAPSVWICGVKR